jgi:signal transduction histidine kinase
VRLPDFVRTTTFRWALAVAGSFVLCTLVLFGFVYWRIAVYMTARVDRLLIEESTVVGPQTVDLWLRQDPRRIKVAGLFGADGRRIEGNIEKRPSSLLPNAPHDAVVSRVEGSTAENRQVRLLAHPLSNGDILLVGRSIDEISEVAEIVLRAIAMGLVPAFALALIIGVVLSRRANYRLRQVNRKIHRIVAGDFRERLPISGRDDPFDQLAISVNQMLGEIEALIREIAGVGDNIAHDLRTPLTRMRVRLERSRTHSSTLGDLQTAVDQAIASLDQSLAMITAILRIAEIEHSRRLIGFNQVELGPLLHEVGDLYEPLAEDKGVRLSIDIEGGDAAVRGDRDLLFESVANLVDNAIKFTPKDGVVKVGLLRRDTTTIIRVEDTGPGISESDCESVTKRFYRSDKSRHTEGLGLGLSLVSAIVKLHGFAFTIKPGRGCTVEIECATMHCA